VFVPVTDIFETPEALTVVLEMPGVDRDSIEANVEDNVVTIQGRIDFSKYEGMQPVYTEYEGRRGDDRAAQGRAGETTAD
jgi:HSP20 family molecular chaperone IbpA